MRIAVQDANILIDLEVGGILEAYLKLDIETYTTDFIAKQLRDGGHGEAIDLIERGVIHERELDVDEIGEIVGMMEGSSGPDMNDFSVLYLASKMDAVLLTGDKALRDVSEGLGVECHGTIWILDRMIEAKVIRPHVAADRLEGLMKRERRLPTKDCEARIQRWRRGR